MLTSIAGRSVIVTGATRGIGRGIARLFAGHGARVLVAARDGAAAEAFAAEIGGIGMAVDVADAAAMTRMAARAVEAHGGIDILCANAGIFPSARIEDMTQAQWDEVQDVNLRGTFLAVSACLPSMRTRGAGRIIVTSSITGPVTGYAGWSHYGASKAGQLGFVRTAAIELARYGITVNAVLPGNILTEGMAALGEAYIATMTAGIPMKRLGSVADIANAALFFASDEAAYVTGQTLVVDGGQILPESLTGLE